MSDIGEWLNRDGLGKYTTSLLENDIGFDIRPSLSSEDLTELGLDQVGTSRMAAFCPNRKFMNCTLSMRRQFYE